MNRLARLEIQAAIELLKQAMKSEAPAALIARAQDAIDRGRAAL